MAGILVNEGENLMLGLLVGQIPNAGTTLSLQLFKNNIVPADTDIVTTYTKATFTGYSAATLPSGSWTLTPGAPSQATYPQITFTCSAATSEAIYGYIITTSSSALVASETFPDGPYVLTNNGDQIKITPKITQD